MEIVKHRLKLSPGLLDFGLTIRAECTDCYEGPWSHFQGRRDADRKLQLVGQTKYKASEKPLIMAVDTPLKRAQAYFIASVPHSAVRADLLEQRDTLQLCAGGTP